MIQLDVTHSGSLAQCSYAGQQLTATNPLALVRQKQTSLRFRFVNASGSADAAITAAMLNVVQLSLVSGTRELARTDSGISTVTGTDNCLALDVSSLVTDTEAVRTFQTDGTDKGPHDGVLCSLEFSARSSTSENVLSLWFALPVELLNYPKASAAEPPVESELYLTAAETRIAAREIAESCAIPETLTSGTILVHHNRIYTKTLTANDAFSFAEPADGARCTFELHLTQPAAAVSFSWGNTIWWMDDSANFAADNEAPDFSTASCTYALVFRYDGTRWLGNLAYTESIPA